MSFLGAMAAFVNAVLSPAAPSSVPDQIISWAQANAPALGVDANTLATALLANSAYETHLGQDPSSYPGAIGPFSFDATGGTYQAAVNAGFDPTTVSGSLDYLLFHDYNRETALAALRAGDFHGFYQAIERPNAAVDAARVARGDFEDALAQARGLASGAIGQPAPGGFTPSATVPAVPGPASSPILADLIAIPQDIVSGSGGGLGGGSALASGGGLGLGYTGSGGGLQAPSLPGIPSISSGGGLGADLDYIIPPIRAGGNANPYAGATESLTGIFTPPLLADYRGINPPATPAPALPGELVATR